LRLAAGALSLGALLASACGAPGPAACDIPNWGNAHSCYAFDKYPSGSRASYCTAHQGTTVEACSMTGVAGVCVPANGDGILYVYSGDVAAQKSGCVASGGSWSNGG
jgi:hypothetical protein